MPDQGRPQVTGAGPFGRGRISLAKSIQTEREPDLREGTGTARDTRGAPRRTPGWREAGRKEDRQQHVKGGDRMSPEGRSGRRRHAGIPEPFPQAHSGLALGSTQVLS